MEYLSAEVDRLVQRSRQFLDEGIKEALESSDPDRRELARELAAGRITAREAASNSGYQEILEAGCRDGLDQYLSTQEKAEDVVDPDDEDFSDHTFLRNK